MSGKIARGDGFRRNVNAALTMRAFLRELEAMRRTRGWWAVHQPVAYVWLRRAERRGAIVPWSEDWGEG